jgi:hypothetical protein
MGRETNRLTMYLFRLIIYCLIIVDRRGSETVSADKPRLEALVEPIGQSKIYAFGRKTLPQVLEDDSRYGSAPSASIYLIEIAPCKDSIQETYLIFVCALVNTIESVPQR